MQFEKDGQNKDALYIQQVGLHQNNSSNVVDKWWSPLNKLYKIGIMWPLNPYNMIRQNPLICLAFEYLENKSSKFF